MSNIEDIKAIGKKIEEQLVAIRKSVGAPISDYLAKTWFSTSEILERAQAAPGEPIIIAGKYCFLYIKDHALSSWDNYKENISQYDNSCFEKGRRVHFVWCSTLRKFGEKERNARYHRAHNTTNKYHIDLNNGRDVPARLASCQNCLEILLKSEKVSWWTRRKEILNLSLYGDAEEIRKRVNLYGLSIGKHQVEETKGELDSSAYPSNWEAISLRYREKCKYRCDVCDVECSKHPRLLDVHHRNRDKSNCDESNLQCLCKYHHTQVEKHHHYMFFTKRHLPQLRQLWEEQGISRDKRG